MKKYILISILTICISAFCSAQQRFLRVPATPHPIEITQPNGEKLTIRLFGDEKHHFNTTLDGFVIIQNEKGVYCYAQIDKNGKIAPSKKQAHNVGERKKCEQKLLKRLAKNPELNKYLNTKN
jgi:uncharacterized protein YdeI (BOF family)